MLTPSDEFALEIIDALKKRDFVFQRATNAIAKKIDFVFDAIVEYTSQKTQTQNMEWESVDINNGLLVIVAKIPASSITGIEHKMLTVGIPIEVIQLQSKDKIVEFFLQAERSRAEREAELAAALGDRFTNHSMPTHPVGSFDDDVDSFDDIDDNNVAMRKPPPKRVLH